MNDHAIECECDDCRDERAAEEVWNQNEAERAGHEADYWAGRRKDDG